MNMSSRPSPSHCYQVPDDLLMPLWMRSQESFIDDGLVYDPIAAQACQRCHLSESCLSGDINQKQLLHVTLTQLCDIQVKAFLSAYPNAWVVNIGAGLDTRFYRLDNGICHWIEVDVDDTLLWRQKLFHHNERYNMVCGTVSNMDWLDLLNIPDGVPVLIVCEQALLYHAQQQVAHLIQKLGCYFSHAQACLVLAGDKTDSFFGKKLGCNSYAHGLKNPIATLLTWLPWIETIQAHSPIEQNHCKRWRIWQKCVAQWPFFKHRLTPTLLHIRW